MLIHEKGMSQKEVAKAIKIGESHMSLLLKNKRRWNMDQIHALSELLGYSMDDITKAIQNPKEMKLKNSSILKIVSKI